MMDEGREEVGQHPEATNNHVLLPNACQKTRSIFTAPVQSYSHCPNPVPLLPNGTPLRPVRYAPLPRFMGPRFPNPQYLNRSSYPMVHGMVPMFPSTTTSPPVLPTPQPQLHQPDNDSQVHYNQQYMGSRFPNTPYLNRPLYPMVPGMVPMFPFAPAAPPNMPMQPHQATNDAQFGYSAAQQLQQPTQFSGMVHSQVLPLDEDATTRNNMENGPILLSEQSNDSQEGQPIDIQVLPPDAFTSLEHGTEFISSESDNPVLQDIAYEVEVETTSNAKKDLGEENVVQEEAIVNNIEEEIEQPSSSSQDYTPPPSPTQQNGKRKGFKLDLDASVHEEVLRAAKALFSKRTRTLYHWLYPEKSKTKLKASVTSAWDTLPENEKHFYISQVLGRFGVQTGTLMINPQLDGIKGYTREAGGPSDRSQSRRNASDMLESSISEERKAVEDMLAVYHDPNSWDLDSQQDQRRRKRKVVGRNDRGPTSSTYSFQEDIQEESGKRMRRSLQSDMDFEGDVELNTELEKFRLFADNEALLGDEDEDIWQQSPKATDLFADFGIL